MREIHVSKNSNLMDSNSISFAERNEQLKFEKEICENQEKRQKNSPFSRWTQFNLEHTEKMMWLTLKHPKAYAILLFLVDQMDDYNAVMCSYQVIQELLSISKATVQRNIRILKENGYIAVLKSGASNVYAINDKVYWKSWGNNKQYSKFPANVVLSLSEQEESIQIKIKKIKHKEIKLND